VVVAGYKSRLCFESTKMSPLLWYFRACTGGVPGQGDAEAVRAGYSAVQSLRCRLCFGFQSLNRVCQDSETREVLERVVNVVCVEQGIKCRL
jgi:hypothetical protein